MPTYFANPNNTEKGVRTQGLLTDWGNRQIVKHPFPLKARRKKGVLEDENEAESGVIEGEVGNTYNTYQDFFVHLRAFKA